MSFTLSRLHFLLKSNQEKFDMGDESFFWHFADTRKFTPLVSLGVVLVCLVIYSVKIWKPFRPKFLQAPLISLTRFWILGFDFSCIFWFIVILQSYPPLEKLCFWSIYLLKFWIFRRSIRLKINILSLPRFELILFDSRSNNYIILPEKLLNLVICSSAMESSIKFKTLANTYSTLNWVFSINSFLLSRYSWEILLISLASLSSIF